MIIRNAGVVIFLTAAGFAASAAAQSDPPEAVPPGQQAPVYELLPEADKVPLIHPSRTRPALEVDPAERSFEIETDLLQRDIRRRKTRGQRLLEAQDQFSDGLRPEIP